MGSALFTDERDNLPTESRTEVCGPDREAEAVIDLSGVKSVLAEVQALVNDLDGRELDDSAAITSQSKGAARQAKAQRSQDLQLLATRLELAAGLVRNEYWFARGEVDPLNRRRS